MLDQETTYLPRGERPAPYPPGMVPGDPRWTGGRFARVEKPADGLAPDDAPPGPRPGPADRAQLDGRARHRGRPAAGGGAHDAGHGGLRRSRAGRPSTACA